MKRITFLLAMILVIALLCGIPSAAAAGKSKKEFATTSGEAFSKYMTEEDYIFTYEGTYENDDGSEEDEFFISFEAENMDSIDIEVFFDSDNEGAVFYVWDYVKFNAKQYDEMQEICNQMNNDYRFAKFYVEDDNTVTVQGDAIFFGNDIGEICECFICTIASIADNVYPAFEEALG